MYLRTYQAAAEKAKKTLSPPGVSEVQITVECLVDEHDCILTLSREVFEDKCEAWLQRLKLPVLACIQRANLPTMCTYECEIVGGTTRVTIVKKTLASLLGYLANSANTPNNSFGLKTTMNADEAIVRGCAYQCALVGSRRSIKPFHVTDRLPYSIMVRNDVGESFLLFEQGEEWSMESRRTLVFPSQTETFNLYITYVASEHGMCVKDSESMQDNQDGQDQPILLSTVTINMPPKGKGRGANRQGSDRRGSDMVKKGVEEHALGDDASNSSASASMPSATQLPVIGASAADVSVTFGFDMFGCVSVVVACSYVTTSEASAPTTTPADNKPKEKHSDSFISYFSSFFYTTPTTSTVPPPTHTSTPSKAKKQKVNTRYTTTLVPQRCLDKGQMEKFVQLEHCMKVADKEIVGIKMGGCGCGEYLCL